MRSRFLQRAAAQAEEHDVSKELFLGIMMLMLTLGIMILNVAQPVWRVHHHDPRSADLVLIYTSKGAGLSTDGKSVERLLRPGEFERLTAGLIAQPERNLHLFLRGGSRGLYGQTRGLRRLAALHGAHGQEGEASGVRPYVVVRSRCSVDAFG